MTKKHFIALADQIKFFNSRAAVNGTNPYSQAQISDLADFCQKSNAQFNRARWLCYIKGECGPSGGTVKVKSGASSVAS